MRAVVPLLAALVLAPASHAGASLSISKSLFAPSAGPLTITGQLDQTTGVGVRLATEAGKPVGWIDPPSARSSVFATWDGTFGGHIVRDGHYRVQLVAGGRVVALTPLVLDATPARLLKLRIASNSTPFGGDGPLLTTLTPNGDGIREYARVVFDLSEPADVTLDIERTASAGEVETLETLSSRTWTFATTGRHSLGWFPPEGLAARTYVLSLTTEDSAGNQLAYGSPNARVGRYPRAPIVRIRGIDAAFTKQSYVPGASATIQVATDEPTFTMQFFKTGPERLVTYADNLLEGVPVTEPAPVDWTSSRDKPGRLTLTIGEWSSGLYFAKFVAADKTIGYAPFVVRPRRLGAAARVAVVLPTNTWQAYNFWDSNGDGWGDTWYAGYPNKDVVRNRPFLHRGVPPFFYRYDQGFLHWLFWTEKKVDFIAESDLDSLTGDDLAGTYDLIVYEGHSEYVTTHEYDTIERYRNLGGNLMFLSANNFFWHVAERGIVITRDAQWRDLGRPESGLIGVQYLANDRGERQGLFEVLSAAPWLWEGTGLTEGSTFGEAVGGYGIEIDHTTPDSPPATLVVAQIPDLFGEGLSAEMSYYETPAGAKVFAAGTLDFGGSALTAPVSSMLENLWARLTKP